VGRYLGTFLAQRLTLLRSFSLLSAALLALIGTLLVWRLQQMVEDIALSQEATLTRGQAEAMLHGGMLPQHNPSTLTPAFARQLGRSAEANMRYTLNVRIKIWSPDGTILYSDAPQAIGKRFLPLDEGLADVLSGVEPSAADISDLGDPENITERDKFTHLLEVYVPIVLGSGPRSHVAGAYEVYHDLTVLDAQEAQVRRAVWVSVGLGFAVLYLSLFLIVRNASRRIQRQDRQNAALLAEARQREDDAMLLYRTSERVRLGTDPDAVLRMVLGAVRDSFGYLNATILLYDKDARVLARHTGTDHQLSRAHEAGATPLGVGTAGRAALLRQIVRTPEIPAKTALSMPAGVSELAIPLVAVDELVGVLAVVSDHHDAFGERDLKVLTILADQAAMVIQNANLFVERERMFLATLDAMANAIDARDPYTAGHSHRVAACAVAIGRHLGLGKADLELLHRAGILHDIGKIGVSDAVLRKPGPLNAVEEAEMRRHPVIGAELLMGMPFLSDELHLIRHHHERWDGTGYPSGLAGEAIPRSARIAAVADAFDAMTSDRPYRIALSWEEARRRLQGGIGSQFWAPAVEAMVALLDDGALDAIFAVPEPVSPPAIAV
jgi:putative nucleotidyltransferase with HDIG domain